MCRELTKKHETVFESMLSQAIAYYEAHEPRGECVIVVEGKSRERQKEESEASWKEMSIEEHMAYYEEQGIDRKEAMKLVAKDRGTGKREIYKMLLKA